MVRPRELRFVTLEGFGFSRNSGLGAGRQCEGRPWPCIRIFVVNELGKILIGLGVVLVVLGLLVVIGGRLHLPLGRLPGDVVYRGKHTSFYFPIVTSILLSIMLSVILYFISRASR